MKTIKMKTVKLIPIILLTLFVGCSNYGEKKVFNNVEVYYSKDITEAQVDSIGKFLIEYFANNDKKSFKIEKKDSKYIFKILVDEEDYKTLDYNIDGFISSLATSLSEDVFNNEPVEAHLCNDNFKTYKFFQSDYFGEKKVFNNAKLYYSKDITEAQVDSVGKLLIKYEIADGSDNSFKIEKQDSKYIVRILIFEPEENYKTIDEDVISMLRLILGDLLSETVFNNEPIEVHICDEHFKTYKILKSYGFNENN